MIQSARNSHVADPPRSNAKYITRLVGVALIGLLAGCANIPGSGDAASSEQAGIDSMVLPPKADSQTLQTDSIQIAQQVSNASSEQHIQPPKDLWERLRRGFALRPTYDHPEVAKRLSRYRNEQEYFDIVGDRAAPFLYELIEVIEERNLPLELALVPFIESTFNPTASSRQNAVGLWQFVPNTGRSYGLTQNWWIDERRDPLESTRAALEYLEMLYQEFDQDWLLALAAYNTGGGNIRRALKRKRSTQSDSSQSVFWELGLAGETRSHVPRILALARVIDDPEAYGIELPPISNSPRLELVELERQIDLSRAAKLAEVDLAKLKAFNPRYLQWATPPEGIQPLYLDADAAQRLRTQLASIQTDSLVTYDRYAIRSGDTLGAIAKKLGTRVDVLQRVNGLNGSRIIAGRSLLVPRGDIALSDIEFPVIQDAPKRTVPPVYTVRRGDNLWSIARRFDIKSEAIRQLNGLEEEPLLKPGQKLRLLARAETIAQRDSLAVATD